MCHSCVRAKCCHRHESAAQLFVAHPKCLWLETQKLSQCNIKQQELSSVLRVAPRDTLFKEQAYNTDS